MCPRGKTARHNRGRIVGRYPENGLTLVMNSDLLTTISFEDMYLHHLSSGADITIAVIPYQVSVPYAILTIDTPEPDLHKVTQE